MNKVNILLFFLIFLLVYILNIKREQFIVDKIFWGIVHIPSYKDRAILVRDTKKKFPFIKTFDAFHKLDDCCKFLAEKNIYISPKYWNNSKEIHKGKVGNSVTMIAFLYFIKEKNYDYGVWIEDDMILSDKNIKEINNIIKKGFNKPMIRLIGIGFEVVIINSKKVDILLEPILKNNIYNPLDTIWNNLNLVDQNNLKIKRLDENLQNSNSTILTTKMVKIRDVNKLINKYK